MSYIGNTPTTQSFISGTDYFNGTGAQTAFTLSRTVASINDIQVTVNNVVQQPNDAYTISGTTLTMTSAPSAGTNNVYVRYLSTTTQAITPSQGTVSWNTLDSNIQQDLGVMFKNRIINGAMVISQYNGTSSVTPTTNQYTLDRWRSLASPGSKYSVQQNAGSVTPPAGFTNYFGVTSLSTYSVSAGDYQGLVQKIEGYNVADLGWGSANAKTVTLSFWVRSSLTGTFGGAIANAGHDRSYPFTYTISSANTWTQISVTIAGDTTGTWLTDNSVGIQVFFGLGVGSSASGTAGVWASVQYFSATGATSVVGTNGATWYVTGVQLEVGTQATTFTTAGGSYGAELALCQRYYERFTGNTNLTYKTGYSYNTYLYLFQEFKVAKRTINGTNNSSASGSTLLSAYGTGNAESFLGNLMTGSVVFSATDLNGMTFYQGLSANTYSPYGTAILWALQNGQWIDYSAEL
jgi:hypothetical protein